MTAANFTASSWPRSLTCPALSNTRASLTLGGWRWRTKQPSRRFREFRRLTCEAAIPVVGSWSECGRRISRDAMTSIWVGHPPPTRFRSVAWISRSVRRPASLRPEPVFPILTWCETSSDIRGGRRIIGAVKRGYEFNLTVDAATERVLAVGDDPWQFSSPSRARPVRRWNEPSAKGPEARGNG